LRELLVRRWLAQGRDQVVLVAEVAPEAVAGPEPEAATAGVVLETMGKLTLEVKAELGKATRRVRRRNH